MVPDIKTIRIKKNKARNRFRAGVLIFTKYILKRIVRLIRLNNKIKKARNQMADICQKNKNIILDLRKVKNYGRNDYIITSRQAHPILLKSFASFVIICLISMQASLISGFEAHIINITAKIVNDVPGIEPGGGQFCNIEGASITLSTTLTGTSTIVYTTDGSDPVCPDGSSVYSEPFTIYQSATVKTRTCHDDKQSAIATQYFAVAMEFCPPSNCNAEPISYWQNNEGCENNPAVSNLAIQINNLSSGHFQSAFATTTAADICTLFDINSCPPEGTLAGELCRAQGEILADLSNIVTGRLDLNAVIAGGFDNSQPFINLAITASSTIEEALNKIEAVLVNPSATAEDLTGAGYVAQRIYTFYSSENPYPSGTCIYYEPGDIVLNEFVPNPSCAAQPVDVALVMDTSGSMNYDSPTRISQAKTAANDFINNLSTTTDQSALVSYGTTAILKKLLSYDHASTTEAINGLTAVGATNIGDGIALANNELTISGHASPAAVKVEILLTDGLANKPNGPGYGEWPADVAYAKAKADEAALNDIKIFTIGLGINVNTSMLQYIATTTGAEYHFAPTGADLKAIYQLISEELCGGGDNDDFSGLAGEWVELYNKGATQKDLANWMIGNSATTTTVTINTGNTLSGLTTIGAVGSGLEWLVVLFNEARLNNSGDTIFLYDNVNHLLDFYSYTSSIDNDTDFDPDNTPGTTNTLDGNLAGQEGKSFARIPDGTGNWIDPIPTPGGPNKLDENMALDITASSTESVISQNNEVLVAPTEQALTNDNANILDNNNQDNENSIVPETVSEDLDNNGETNDPAGVSAEAGDSGTVSLNNENISSSTESNEIISGNNDNADNSDNSDDNTNNNSEPEEVKSEPAPELEPSQNDNSGVGSAKEQATEPSYLINIESGLSSQPTTL